MNFRRLVSAVAALAVAGTMCAGLAVTASADTVKIVNDDFNSATQATATTSLKTDYMTWSTSSTATVSIRNIAYNGYSSTSGAYLYPMPLARSNQGNFYSKDGNFLYLAGNVTVSSPTATGTITNSANGVTDGSISFDFAFPSMQNTNNRYRNNNVQTLSITDGTNAIAEIEVTAYPNSTSNTGAYDWGAGATVVIGDGGDNTVTYTSTSSATTVGWYSLSMTISEGTVTISVTTPASTTLTTSYKYDASTIGAINTLSWSGTTTDTNNVAGMVLDNIVFSEETEYTPEVTTIKASGIEYVEYGAGKKIQMSATAYDQNDNLMDATITWKSSAEDVATIDSTGVATLVGSGDVTFTASSGDATPGTVNVTVAEATAASNSLKIGEDYSSITDGTTLVSQGYSSGEATDLVDTTINGITYTQSAVEGNRNNTDTYITVSDSAAVVYLGYFASSNRSPRMIFENAPTLSDVTAEKLEFDITLSAAEQVRIYDGSDVSTAATAFAYTSEGDITLNEVDTGLASSGSLHVSVILTDGSIYTELTDTNGITYADLNTTTLTSLGGIFYGGDTARLGKFAVVDNIKLYTDEEPTMTAAYTAATTDISADPAFDTESDTLYTASGTADYTEVVGNSDVKTVYIKMNSKPTVAPTVTLTNDNADEAQATISDSGYNLINGSYYFIYQFVNVDDYILGAEVTCNGFDDAYIEE